MRFIDRVTITGADDGVDPSTLADIDDMFPFWDSERQVDTREDK